jgi:hypothetical protein
MNYYMKLKFDKFNSNLQLDKDKTVKALKIYLVILLKAFFYTIYKFIFSDWLLLQKTFPSNNFQKAYTCKSLFYC